MNSRIIYFIVLVLLVFFVNCKGNHNNYKSEVAPYPNIEIPIFPSGYDIEKDINKPPGTKSVSYSVKTEYPASNVLKFYEEKFVAMGWIQVSGIKVDKNNWESFTDDTVKGSPQVRQLLTFWRDSENKNEAFIALRYRKFKNEVWNDKLFVVCQIQPYFNLEKIDVFLEKLKTTGEYSSFMELLDKYRLKNGNIDLNKAVKENQNNDLLLEYYKLINEINPDSKERIASN